MLATAILTLLLMESIGCDDASILIVGAGPAGIAAATKLLENGITNFRILEAEARIGGRVHSVHIGDAYVDLGAQWCHGEVGNVVYDMVKDMGLLEHSGTPRVVLHSSKRPLDQRFGKELVDLMMHVSERAYKEGTTNETVGQFCTKVYLEEIQSRYGGEKFDIAKNALDFFEHIVISNEGSFNWFEPICGSDFIDARGDYALNWKNKGFTIFLDILMKKYPEPSQQLAMDDKILFDKEVVNIYWDATKSTSGVTVKCKDGSKYISSHVIFTPSLGVLKATVDEMFVPKLSRQKVEAINSIGFAAVMKVVLQFPEKWWNHTDGTFIIWTDEDIKTVSNEYNEGPKLEGRSWITHLFAFVWNDHTPNVMTAWLTGPLVPEIEKLPIETLQKGIYFILNKFMGHDHHIGQIKQIIPSRWYTNPHFRGTYSYQTTNTTLKANGRSSEEALAEPIPNEKGKPLIQFAGEATNPVHYSTVHGAVETGYREAQRLITLYKNTL